jgi:hypothetical protein
MSQPQPVIHLRCPENIQWAREAEQILVVDGRGGQAYALRGVEAAVWSWLALAYPYPQIVGFLAELLAAPVEQAEQRLAAILKAWLAAGLLEVKEAASG